MFRWVRILVSGLLLALAARAAERDVTQAFPVEPGCRLNVDLYHGGITVEESDEPEVRVALHLEIGVDTEAEADRACQSLQLELKSDRNTVTVRARNPAESGVRFIWNDKNQIDLACKITVPRQCSVELRTGRGPITVGSLTGRVVAHTETGTIFIHRIDGSIEAGTQYGDVIVSRCSGAVALTTWRGTIRAGTLGGPATLENTTGDIEVMSARARLTAYAEAGDATVGFPRDFTGDADIRTSGGSIQANIDPAANCNVRASSVWGRVQDKLPFVVESGGNGKSKFAGRLNEGGPVLTLHANGGQVRILPGEAFLE